MLLESARRGCAADGALLAALASERDILAAARAFGSAAPESPSGPSDLLMRAELFEDAARNGFAAQVCHRLGLDVGAVRAVERARRQLRTAVPRTADRSPHPDLPPRGGKEVDRRRATSDERPVLLRCILAGFPDRVVRRRAPGSPRGVMVGGTGVELDASSGVRDAELFVAVEVEGGRGPELRVRIASAVERAWLDEMFPQAMAADDELVFDPVQQRVVRRMRERFRDLVLAERVHTDVDRSAAGAVLAAAFRRDPALLVPGDDERTQLARLRFLQRWMPELGLPPDPGQLYADAVVALCEGKRSLAELRGADVLGMLRGLLTRPQLAALEREAPERYTLPTGRAVALAYEPDCPPSFAARIQEVFGLRATPRLAGGRVPVVIQLLSPSQRPVQITDDLESFWRSGYAEVRKQLRGRYPKHPWPEDPLSAEPTARAKRRGG
jgi:ATP-dependent helicase HrpB